MMVKYAKSKVPGFDPLLGYGYYELRQKTEDHKNRPKLSTKIILMVRTKSNFKVKIFNNVNILYRMSMARFMLGQVLTTMLLITMMAEVVENHISYITNGL